MSASQVLAKGPLSSALGQWAFVGLGAYALAGGEALKDVASKTATITAQLAAGVPLSTILEANSKSSSKGNATAAAIPAPIVIHTSGSSSDSSGKLLTDKPLIFLVQLTLGAGLCWGSYIVFSNLLPEQIKEMLPVTRKFFDAAVTSLGKGILQVKESLGEQILGLSAKQDELSEQQTETHQEVLSVRNDLGEVKFDLNAIADTVERCEASLTHAERRQSYTARGVRLLVRCVGAMMPGNARLASELDRFAQQGDEMGFQDDSDSDFQKSSQSLAAIEGPGSYPALPQCTPGTTGTGRSHSTPMTSARSRSAGENPQMGRTPSYVTPNVARALNCGVGGGGDNGTVSSVDTAGDPECAGHEPVTTPMTAPGTGGKGALPPPTPQDLDEVRLLLDMVRRGGTVSVK